MNQNDKDSPVPEGLGTFATVLRETGDVEQASRAVRDLTRPAQPRFSVTQEALEMDEEGEES